MPGGAAARMLMAGPGFAVVETLLHPSAAAPAHVHDNSEEAVFVIEGRTHRLP